MKKQYEYAATAVNKSLICLFSNPVVAVLCDHFFYCLHPKNYYHYVDLELMNSV